MPRTVIHVENRGVTPAIAPRNCAEAVDWYVEALGAVEQPGRIRNADGTVGHTEIEIAGGVVSLADHWPGSNHTPDELGGSTVNLSLYVDDVDAFVARAVEHGATLRFPVKDQFYGERSGRIVDPYGFSWIVSTRFEDVSPEEMQRRYDAEMQQMYAEQVKQA